jgi:cell division protein FtsI/penicillin-binding protein 2
MAMRRNLPLPQIFACPSVAAIFLAAIAGCADLRAARNLQAFVSTLLPEKDGAAIVSDPRTGQIIALVSPHLALEEAYPPGSTAKIVTSAAALEEGTITPSETVMCRRVPRLLGEAYHCSHPPADSPYDLANALANSCNYFFSELSTRLSPSILAHWYATFGFGARGQEASHGEVIIPEKPEEKALAALGERGITATPSQLLLAYSAVAEQGKMFDLIMPGQHKTPRVNRVISLQKKTLMVLTEGLRDCVEAGSCHAAAIQGLDVAGKTGTGSALDGSGVTHAWFVGYAPADAPEIALVIFLKRGTGGASAAPLAAQILREYFADKPHTP